VNPRGANALLVGTALLLLCGCNEKARVLSPDLLIAFSCRNIPDPQQIASFAGSHGFAAFDEEGERRKQGRVFYALQVDAVDRNHRLFDVIGLPEPPSFGGGITYKLTITGPPPSHHDLGLETEAHDFIASLPGCRISSENRYDNSAQSAAMFQFVYLDEVRRIEDGKHRNRHSGLP